MGLLQGFWSYVHADDQAEGERIARLARDVAAQFEMFTGETLELFLDRDSLSWGEIWREKIDGALGSVAFFIPVLTPRYFMSPECRRELQYFARKATSLGMKELVLPLHYVEVPALRQDDPKDDLVKLIRNFQWEDWTDLRFADLSSESYRRGVAKLAERLAEGNTEADKVAVLPRALEVRGTEPGEDELPGFLDRVASSEESLPRLVSTVGRLNEDIVIIGKEMEAAAAEARRGIQNTPGFAARLITARKLAHRLAEPAERIWMSGNEYATQLHEVDLGFRAIIERAPEEAAKSAEAKLQLCEFFRMVCSLAHAAHAGLTSAQGMIDSTVSIENMSRDLRPVLRRLRQGLTTMVEARGVSDEWVHLIEASGVECDSAPE